MTRSFVSPSQYVQAVGILDQIGSRVHRLGESALLVTDEIVHGIIDDSVEQSLSTAGVEYRTAIFDGECTEDEIDRLAEIARDERADVIIGAGGGKSIDVAKGVRGQVGGSFISLPTVASTDAPTSGFSVVYTSDGRVAGGIVHDRRPDLVLVDPEIIVQAPSRWFISGVGDALATHFEAAATVQSGGQTVAGGTPTRAGVALAEQCYDVLRVHAPAAVDAIREATVTDAVEETVEAIILLSGLGFENGGLAAAHAIHDGIASTVETEATHGEKVCFGLLTQLVLEGRPDEEVADLVRFASDIGLPVTLVDLGVSTSHIDDIADATCRDGSSITNQPGNPTPMEVSEALLAADELGRSLE